VPDRATLAATLAHLVATRTPLGGAAHHGVSEALYLDDPEGNGIEIYRDLPREAWPRTGGRLAMVTEPLDLDHVLGSAGDAAWQGQPAGTRVGHVHLKVSDLAAAERFYTGVAGFDLVQRLGGGAAFVSAGGYHHHVGLNTWESRGAPARSAGAAGLGHVEVRVLGDDGLERLTARLRASGAEVGVTEDGVATLDPSGNRLRFVTAR
jgi:catechol 2,3-dioxygenase